MEEVDIREIRFSLFGVAGIYEDVEYPPVKGLDKPPSFLKQSIPSSVKRAIGLGNKLPRGLR
ncbi:hypothetical protein CVH13_00284 [Dehalococcoides mccartyi]|uniref:Uncharacterized protein n=1 Tax=Dehalococcoides mccartyi TaxID=61435 RepID=A0A2J1E009_9CHLR|nr:hypothetical protein CVH13_00284 [Dehalococcoides mccartyi]